MTWCLLTAWSHWGWILQAIDRNDMRKTNSMMLIKLENDNSNLVIRAERKHLRITLHCLVLPMLRIGSDQKGTKLHPVITNYQFWIPGPT
jgi:hypothetical protein